jgi:hypothetical protein
MATVIDELIVVLGLDATKFTQGQKQALETWTKTRDAAKKNAQEMEKGFSNVEEAVLGVSKRLLSLGALFVGGLGIREFTDNIKRLALEMTGLQRAAANAGISAQGLKAFGNVGAAMGLNPQEVMQSIGNMRAQIAQFRVFAGSNSLIVQALKQAGISVADIDKPGGMDNVLLRINKYANDLRRQGVKQPEITARLGAFGFSPDVAFVFSQPENKFKDLLETMKKYAPSETEIQKMKDLQEQIAKTNAAFEKLGYRLGELVAGPLGKLLTWVETFLNMFKPNVVTPEDTGKIQSDIERQNREMGIGGPSPAQRLWNWWQGTGGFSNLNPIGSANASPSVGSEGTSGIGGKGNINLSGGRGAVAAGVAQQLRQAGLPESGVAAVLGNIQQESGFNPTLRHPDQPRYSGEAHYAHGLYQEGGPDWPIFQSWLNQNRPGRNWTDPNIQTEFFLYNLKKNHPEVWQRLMDPNRSVRQKAIDLQGGKGWGYFRPAAGAAGTANRVGSAEGFFRNPPGTGDDVWSRGAGAIPFSDWLTNPQTRNLMRAGNVTTTNNRTSNQVSVGNIAVNTQATDAQGIVRDLKPLLTNDLYTQPFNYGPN